MKIKTVGDLKEIMRGLPDDSSIRITSLSGDQRFLIDAKILTDGTKQLFLITDFRTYTDEDLENIYLMYKRDREAKKGKASRMES